MTPEIDVYAGSQYFIGGLCDKNMMCTSENLIERLTDIIDENNYKNVQITMYVEITETVKIKENVKYFDHYDINDQDAVYVSEIDNRIYTTFKFSENANVLVSPIGSYQHHIFMKRLKRTKI